MTLHELMKSKIVGILVLLLPLVVAPLIVYLRKAADSNALWYWGATLAVVVFAMAIDYFPDGNVPSIIRWKYWITGIAILVLIVLLVLTCIAFFKVSPLAGMILLLPPLMLLLDSFLHFHP